MRKIICTFMVLIMALGSVSFAFADTNLDNAGSERYIEINAENYLKDAGVLNEKVNDALEISDHVKITNIDKLDNDISVSGSSPSDSSIEPKSAAGYIIYNVRNIKSLSNTFGGDYLNVSGSPGITIGLSDSRTKSYAITFGATFGCSSATIASASWGTTKSRTLTYSGTWKVPAKHAGKKVKKGYLHMRPEYKRKQYDVYSRVIGYTNWKKKGTSTTKRASSVDIYKTYTYK